MQEIDSFVVIPTYNEADNINPLIEQLLALPTNLGVVVVDDNSPDGTGKIVDDWADKFPQRVFALHRPGKMGLGTAHIAGITKAMYELNAKRVLTMDADFSHSPRYIPAMVEMSQQKHVVIGSRYVQGGGQRYCTWKRIMLSKIANLITRWSLGFQAKDTTAGFRLYRREVLETIPLDRIFSNGYSFLVEMLFMVERRGWQVGEVPIIFEDRRFGTTKISKREIIKAQYTVLRLFLRRLRGREPQRAPLSVTS